MKQIKLFIAFSMLIALTTSCIKRIPQTDRVEANTKESIDVPRVIRDTVIIVEKEVAEVLLDTEDIVQTAASKPAVQAPRNNTATPRTNYREDERVDPNNSGFFDRYQQNFSGDPNKNLKPTKRVITKDNSADLEEQKAALAKTLDKLEEANQAEQERAQRLERERQAYNEEAMRKAREQQQKPRGKTLNTDLLLKDNKRR